MRSGASGFDDQIAPGAPESGCPGRLRRRILIFGIVFASSLFVSGSVLWRGQVGFLNEDGFRDDSHPIQDFTSHLAFTRGVWSLGVDPGLDPSAYSVNGHYRILSRATGRPEPRILPFGYSPTMLFVLLPLCFFPVGAAYFLWTLFGAAASGWMLSTPRFYWVLGLMALLSPLAAASIGLGQTAVLGVAGVFLLLNGTLDSPTWPRGLKSSGDTVWFDRRNMVPSLILCALGSKPPLAILAGSAMLSLGFVRPVLGAFLMSLVLALIATPFLGPGWVADYAGLLGTYHHSGAPNVFDWSLRPEQMSNLRASLSVDLGVGDGLASRVSNLVWLCGQLGVCLMAWRRWISPSITWALSILAFLLFCSHVSFTDELFLILVPAALAPWGMSVPSERPYPLWILATGALFLSPGLGLVTGVRPSPLFFLELGLFGWCLFLAYRDRHWQSAAAAYAPAPEPGKGKAS